MGRRTTNRPRKSKARRRRPGESDAAYEKRIRRLDQIRDATRRLRDRKRGTDPKPEGRRRAFGASARRPKSSSSHPSSEPPRWERAPLPDPLPPATPKPLLPPPEVAFSEQQTAWLREQEQTLDELFTRIENCPDVEMIEFSHLVLWRDAYGAHKGVHKRVHEPNGHFGPTNSTPIRDKTPETHNVFCLSDPVHVDVHEQGPGFTGGGGPLKGPHTPVNTPRSAVNRSADDQRLDQRNQIRYGRSRHERTTGQLFEHLVLRGEPVPRGEAPRAVGTSVGEAVELPELPAASGCGVPAHLAESDAPASGIFAAPPLRRVRRAVSLPAALAGELLVVAAWLTQSRLIEVDQGHPASCLTLRFGFGERSIVDQALRRCYHHAICRYQPDEPIEAAPLGFAQFAGMVARCIERHARTLIAYGVRDIADWILERPATVSYAPALCVRTSRDVVALYEKRVSPELAAGTFAILTDQDATIDDEYRHAAAH